jgi:shikimate kinase
MPVAIDILMLAATIDKMLTISNNEKCQHDDYKCKRNKKNIKRRPELAKKRRDYIKNNAEHVSKVRSAWYQKNKDVVLTDEKRKRDREYSAAKRKSIREGRLSTDGVQ